jgi:hypothetical protein
VETHTMVLAVRAVPTVLFFTAIAGVGRAECPQLRTGRTRTRARFSTALRQRRSAADFDEARRTLGLA